MCICSWKLNVSQFYTLPDIACAVSVFGRFQSNLRIVHCRAAKIVMRCLQRTKISCLFIAIMMILEVWGTLIQILQVVQMTWNLNQAMCLRGPVGWFRVRVLYRPSLHPLPCRQRFLSCYKATRQYGWRISFRLNIVSPSPILLKSIVICLNCILLQKQQDI